MYERAFPTQRDEPGRAQVREVVVRRRLGDARLRGERREARRPSLQAFVALDGEQLTRLSDAGAVELGFPRSFLADNEVIALIFGTTRQLIDA